MARSDGEETATYGAQLVDFAYAVTSGSRGEDGRESREKYCEQTGLAY